MSVTLLANTPNPERVVAAAARLCYAPVGAADLIEGLTGEEVGKLLRTILKSGHLSVCEHATFTFAIEGISRACSHQLVRHRVASYSQQSQRYVKLSKPPMIIPPEVEARPELAAEFIAAAEAAYANYHSLLEAGVEAEDARYLLPQAVETKIVVTMNARELLHLFTLRTCERAQWEIRALAEEMLKLVLPLAPTIFAKAGPACVRGRCPEGKFYCQKPRKLTSDGLIVVDEKTWVYRGQEV
ncbi:MAG: FAD-dependent thymidylate synthase [Actinomycetota bacterium]|nr:FAD-dependent thymidylate synthase [Actinomycetota bacterium]